MKQKAVLLYPGCHTSLARVTYARRGCGRTRQTWKRTDGQLQRAVGELKEESKGFYQDMVSNGPPAFWEGEWHTDNREGGGGWRR